VCCIESYRGENAYDDNSRFLLKGGKGTGKNDGGQTRLQKILLKREWGILFQVVFGRKEAKNARRLPKLLQKAGKKEFALEEECKGNGRRTAHQISVASKSAKQYSRQANLKRYLGNYFVGSNVGKYKG